MSASDRLMTRKEVAAMLQVEPNTIQRWHWKGQDAPPFIKIGRSVRYWKSEVEAWVERNSTQANTKTLRFEWQAVGDDGKPYGPVNVHKATLPARN
jgi:excisionase family DNA binding protein